MSSDLSHSIVTASSSEFWFGLGVAVLLTAATVFSAFVFIGRRRVIEDTPTALIRSAPQGYIELRGQGSLAGARWQLSSGFTDAEIDLARNRISSGIISEALATGKTIITPDALLDPRFNSLDSVELWQIGAVLCAPIGEDVRTGVIYLHSADSGTGFTDDDRARVEVFASHLAPFAERLIKHEAGEHPNDPTEPFRRSLAADGVVGRSPALARVLETATLVAPLDVNVLLTGPTGSGKSLIAKVIHDSGKRRLGPFVELNCSTLSPDLIENELFGAERGAHSTAHRAVQGKVASAEGGTLFLDEVAELPLESQAKLLQLLQTKRYFPLGGTQPVEADIRLISATNKPLEDALKRGHFREDLYYRLQVLEIALPSLAERAADIPLLCEQLVASAQRRHGLDAIPLSPEAMTAVRFTEWPGNIRQLANVLEAGSIRAHGQHASEILVQHVFPEQTDEEQVGRTWAEATRQFQRDLLRQTLEDCQWNISEAARRLGLARSHVYSLRRTLNVEPKTAP